MTTGAGSNRGRAIRWTVATLLIAATVLMVAFASRFGSDPLLVESPLIGKPVPVIDLPYLEEERQFSIDDLRGEIVVVNFWASWCIPCRTEHPELLAAASAYEDLDVTFLAVLYQDSVGGGIRFLDDLGRSESTVYVVDSDSRTALDFGVFGIPETFFVDRDGTIVGKVNSGITYPLLTQTIDRILIGASIDASG